MSVPAKHVASASLDLARAELQSIYPFRQSLHFHIGRTSAAALIEPCPETLAALNECLFLMSYAVRHNLLKGS